MSGKRQKNQLELAFTAESRSEAPRAAEEGTEALVAKGEAESPAVMERLMEEVCERQKQTAAGEAGRNPQAGRRNEEVGHSDGAGSVDPASGVASAAKQMGPDV